MAEDRELLKTIWEGKIPISFQLATEDIKGDGLTPSVVYYFVPRITYFPIALEKIKRSFLKFIDESAENNQAWLDYKGQILKLHYPVGLLYDLYAASSSSSLSSLPWPLTLHFSNFPEHELLQLDGGAADRSLEHLFIHVIKEADLLKHRGQIIQKMHINDHKLLWRGLHGDRFDQFWSVNRKLMVHNAPPSGASSLLSATAKVSYPSATSNANSSQQDGGGGGNAEQKDVSASTSTSSSSTSGSDAPACQSGGGSGFRFIPIRVYQAERPGYLQRQVKPFLEDGQEASLGDAIQLLAPHISLSKEKFEALIHGISVPLNSPLQWLSEHLSYPDNFLHVVINAANRNR